MAGTAHAAELIPCDRCNGHYVVDASSDGKPRVRCNKCGHLREGSVEPSPMSVPGKWTVIGPDGKAMSFDSWEELTESRRPNAIAANAKGMEEADKALKELSSKEAKKSASALLDVTPAPAPAPKLALAEMDSAMDLGEPIGSRPKSRISTTGSAPQSGKLEPLLVRSFHPQSQAPKSTTKLEWAPKIDAKSVPAPATKSDTVPRGDHDNTLRVDLAPSHRLDAPITAKVIEAERPTAPNMSDDAPDSIDELDPDSLLEDEDEESPLSLRDAIPEGDELGADDLEEEAPDPHEMLSLRDLVVAPQVAEKLERTAPMPTVEVRQSHPPAPPPRPQSSPSLSPPKPSGPPRPAPAASQPPVVPRSQIATIPPTRPRLSRPDLGISSPPPSSRAADDLRRRSETRAAVGQEPSSSRNYILGGLALLVLAGIAWRLLGSGAEAEKPKPAPTSTVATIAPSTPVTAPTTTATTAPTDTTATETPVTTATTATTPVSTAPVATNTTTAKPPADTTTKKPVATNDTEKPAATDTKKPVAPPVGDSPGSMSDLLDKAGSARRKGDYATARDLYSKVIAMSPNNVEANGGLGDVARAQGDLAGAKSSYERALAASPTYSPALLGLADVEWDQGNKPSAIRRYAQIVDRLGDRAPARAKERSNSAQ